MTLSAFYRYTYRSTATSIDKPSLISNLVSCHGFCFASVAGRSSVTKRRDAQMAGTIYNFKDHVHQLGAHFGSTFIKPRGCTAGRLTTESRVTRATENLRTFYTLHYQGRQQQKTNEQLHVGLVTSISDLLTAHILSMWQIHEGNIFIEFGDVDLKIALAVTPHDKFELLIQQPSLRSEARPRQ